MAKCQPYLNINNGQVKYIINYKNKEISLIIIELYMCTINLYLKLTLLSSNFIQPTMPKKNPKWRNVTAMCANHIICSSDTMLRKKKYIK